MTDNFYSQRFIEDIIDNFNKNQHNFIIIYNGKNIFVKKSENVKMIFVSNNDMRRSYSEIIKLISNNKNIVFHSVSGRTLFFFNKYIENKNIYWCIWGADLYKQIKINLYSKETKKYLMDNNNNRIINLVKKIYVKKLYKKFIKNINYVLTWNYGDYKLAKKHLNLDADLLDFSYSLRLKDNPLTFQEEQYNNNVLVGNSGDPTNNHEEIFKKLSKFKDEINVFCFLSYGDNEYINHIIKIGKQYFGEKFFPITKYLNEVDYFSFIDKLDVVIINHYRQQGIGNIVSFLQKGKKVYMNKCVTTFDYLTNNDITVFSNTDLNTYKHIDELFNYSNNIKVLNSVKAYELFSDIAALKRMKVVFEDEV